MSVTLERRTACPKHMEYGPCGGVDFDGSCEVGDFRCVFLDTPTVLWHGVAPPVRDASTVTGDSSASGIEVHHLGDAHEIAVAPQPGAARLRELLATRQIVIADFPGRPLDRASLAECADALAGRVDATLAGDSGRSRVQFPPAYRALLIQERGLAVWTGLNCRDRNRVALEGELAGLADVGVAGVHCVTGDHTATGNRPDALPVFDLDSTQVAALARQAGHLVSVGESPTTPPTDRRAARLAEKVRAGADLCFVNHAGGVEPVRRFIAESHDLGVAPGFIACVPMVVDHGSAALLKSFTTLVLPEGYLDGILASADPLRAGLDAATRLCEQLLELEGVVGVDLSGGANPGAEVAFAEAMGTVAERLALQS
ncbi:methylenetetrahydrofolate reductase C-terminal domain-containing protein [Herbiconiux moechotypicola]|uniref:Methylenetetrahydrofolate reductase C-terminal domain-containing protein n=1 Tax=Herbiconiux moechotypicola TaxID=637393 RepID=A0ABN3E5V0_9MICO|nr:methylenetetrahydrofolate reductase C-terminal domain-containing protein [Herbiconiux moechotypicola]MCS5731918.1 methylenetetrahydrofolate reductase C-terminal domain-containing protein [Herbiconiux moechotypicola]